MKKVLAAIAFSFVLLSLHTPYTYAEPEGTPRGSTVKEEVKTRNLERKEDNAARFCELRKDKITTYFTRMLTRIGALIERLQKLVDRIESRIAKIESANENINLTNPKAELSSAQNNLSDAKTKLETLKNEADTFVNCDDPQKSFKDVRENVQTIKKDLMEVHRILVHIIGNIKGLRLGNTHTATPSATGSPIPTP